jgi:hypothetical protein
MSRCNIRTETHYNGALPAAGAYTSQPFRKGMEQFDRVGFLVSYTGASATSAPKMRVRWLDGADNQASDGRLINPALAGEDVTSTEGNDVITFPAPGAGVAIALMVSVLNPGGMSGIRLEIAEAGDVANPGTVLCTLQASGS